MKVSIGVSYLQDTLLLAGKRSQIFKFSCSYVSHTNLPLTQLNVVRACLFLTSLECVSLLCSLCLVYSSNITIQIAARVQNLPQEFLDSESVIITESYVHLVIDIKVILFCSTLLKIVIGIVYS